MDYEECRVEYRRNGGDGHFFTMTEEGVPILHVNNGEFSPEGEGKKHWGNRLLNAAVLCCVATTLASDLTGTIKLKDWSAGEAALLVTIPLILTRYFKYMLIITIPITWI